MNAQNEKREDITIFWDFESTVSTSAASAISTYGMITNIRSAVASYGSLRSIRAYWDYASHSDHSAAMSIRGQLSSSGVCLIDCPAEGRRAAATKKMLVDMMLQAWDYGVVHTFVVITSDRDLSYALAMLRMRNYRVILISPANSHVDLISQATIQLDWSKTAVGINGGVHNEKGSQDPPAVGSAPPSGPPPFSVPPPPHSTNSGHETYYPSLELHELPSHSRAYRSRDAGFGIFDLHSVYMTSPKTMASIGLGDGPLFPRPKSTDLKTFKPEAFPIDDVDPVPPFSPYHTQSESGLASRDAFTTKGKEKNSSLPSLCPDESAYRPPSGLTKLAFSGSVFAPRDEDSVAMQSRPLSLTVNENPSATTPASSSQGSTFSVVQMPTASTAPTSVKTDDGKLQDDKTNVSRAVMTDNLGLPLPQNSNPNFVGETANPVLNSVLSRRQSNDHLPVPAAVPVQRPQASTRSIPRTSAPAQSLSSVTLPPAWIPLIRILRKYNGVLRRNIIAPELLKTYPRAFEIAGTNRISTYLQAAVNAGIVRRELRSGIHCIVLHSKYMS